MAFDVSLEPGAPVAKGDRVTGPPVIGKRCTSCVTGRKSGKHSRDFQAARKL